MSAPVPTQPAPCRLLLPVLLAIIGLLAGCAQLKPRPELPVESAIPVGTGGKLDYIAEHEARHPGQSGFRLVVDGTEAFATRLQTARLATRSLDVQTYIWHDDLTGMYMVQELLAGADRGVKVRVLVDDMDARAKNVGFAALAAHPNIEVRMFNPFASRSGTMSLVGEGLTSFKRVNRRMHNKTWIADNRVAIAGGRNIGDEYYGASEEVNFIDLDFAMVGPVVRDASASFDRYWNASPTYPIEILDPEGVNEPALQQLRERLKTRIAAIDSSRYKAALRDSDVVRRMLEGDWPIEWTADFKFIADDPLKVTMEQQDATTTNVGAMIVPEMRAAQSHLRIISPYFVPGERGSEFISSLATAGKSVRILTNSLVANDVAAVHGGYSTYRPGLLESGVELWELKPQPGQETKSSLFGSSGASLHTKAFTIDGKRLFVGSYNLDPRSTWLNCEQGVLVGNDVLTKQLEEIFADQISGAHSWHVTMLPDKKLHWSDGTEEFDSDPKATAGKKFQAWFARAFGLEGQL